MDLRLFEWCPSDFEIQRPHGDMLLAAWIPKPSTFEYRGLNNYLYYFGVPYYKCSIATPKPYSVVGAVRLYAFVS